MNRTLLFTSLASAMLAGCSSGGTSSSAPPAPIPTATVTVKPTTAPTSAPTAAAVATFGPLVVVLADVDNANLIPIAGGFDTRVHYVSNGPMLVTNDGYVAFVYVNEPVNTNCELDLLSPAVGFSANQHFDTITPPPPGATIFQHQVATFIGASYTGSTTVTAQLVCGAVVSKRYSGPLVKT